MFFIDSLPERYKQEVIRTFPHLIGEQKKPDIMEKITIDLRAIAYYSDFALPDGRHLTADKQSVLSNNASILRSLSTMLRDSDAMAGRLGSSKIKRGDFWQRMADAIADGSISLPNTLPKNARSLSRLHQRFETEGYGALISKRYGNSDAAKVATEAQRSALMLLISKPNNLNDEQICRAYNHFAQSQEPQWPEITRQTVAKEREKKIEAYRAAYGNLPEKRRIEMTRERYLMAFGQSNGRSYTLQGTGITATLGGSRIDYDCFDLTFRQHADKKWTLRIDANDLSTVMAESADGQYRYILERKYEQPMALIDRTEEATAELQRVRNFKKQVRDHVTETLANAACKVEEVIRENPNAIDTAGTLQQGHRARMRGQRSIRQGDHPADHRGERVRYAESEARRMGGEQEESGKHKD